MKPADMEALDALTAGGDDPALPAPEADEPDADDSGGDPEAVLSDIEAKLAKLREMLSAE